MKELDWANLPFGYMKTDYNVRIYYRNEQWGELEVCSEETIPMHMAATCLHYGQEAFEGLKAFRGKDGKVRILPFGRECGASAVHLPGYLDAGAFYGAFQGSHFEGGEAERAFHSAL